MNSETRPRELPLGNGFELPSRPFGRYRPIAVLGHGGMATVYLATAQGPGNFSKLVVAKELRPELAGDPEFRAMFLDEARLAARLHHPNIVQTFEVLDEDLQLVIVMEYLDGQPMNRIRQRLGGSSKDATHAMLRIMADMLGGLHYAHELADYDGTLLHVVHRDVSPHNVFVTYAGETKLVDFGVAKVADASARTRTGVIKGKLSYMAPEQALGQPIDRRADIFAAGLMLWEIVAARRVWKGCEDVIMGRLNAGTIPKLLEACPEAPAPLVSIVDRATAANPEDRYPTAAAFQGDLEAYLSSLTKWPTSRQAGAIVAEAFVSERDRIRGVIEQQMSEARAARQLPTIDERQELSGPGTHGSRTMVTTTESFNKSTSLSKRQGTEETNTDVTRSRKGLAIALATGVASTLVAIVASVALLRGRAPVAPVSSETPVAPTAAEPLAAPPTAASVARPPDAPRTIKLRIRVPAPKAVVWLDGKLLDGNPVELSREADGSTHQLRATAPGYVPRTVQVVFDSDQDLELKLQRAAARGGQPGGGEPDLGF
jgi:serine/threonine-protein kinase